jgi:Protein of unknown function (DUF2961)
MFWLPIILCGLVPTADPTPAGREAVVLAGIEQLGRKGDANSDAAEAAEYPVETQARNTQVFLLPDGPRTVRSLEIVATPATAAAWRAARLRLVWDDDDPDKARAAVDLPIGLAFGRNDAEVGNDSPVIGNEGDAWVLRLPMPYRTRAIVRIDAQAPLAGLIRVRSTRGIAPDAGYLHAAEWSGRERLSWEGRGHVVGFRRTGEDLKVALDDAPARPRAGSKPGPWTWFLAEPARFTRSFSLSANADDATTLIYWYADRPGEKRDGGR